MSSCCTVTNTCLRIAAFYRLLWKPEDRDVLSAQTCPLLNTAFISPNVSKLHRSTTCESVAGMEYNSAFVTLISLHSTWMKSHVKSNITLLWQLQHRVKIHTVNWFTYKVKGQRRTYFSVTESLSSSRSSSSLYRLLCRDLRPRGCGRSMFYWTTRLSIKNLLYWISIGQWTIKCAHTHTLSAFSIGSSSVHFAMLNSS